MKKIKLYRPLFIMSCLFILLASSKLTATTYYVSTGGANGNNGTSRGAAWRTIQHAADNVVAGDIVYIEAGNYGHENIVFSTSGTATAKITFAGYTNTPGDNPSINYTFGDSLDSTIMPLLDGGNRSTAGTAITLNGHNYIIVKNIQLQNYNIGLYGYNIEHCSIENIIAIELGDPTASYNGRGIVVGSYSNNNTIKKCIVSNACAEGISVTGNNNIVNKCKVYCDDARSVDAAMDYYIVINGNDNVINDCYIERVGNIPHDGHGIQLKGTAENNLIKDCIAVNQGSSFGVRHRGVKYNIFENCTALGFPNSGWTAGFIIRDGASYNTFKKCRTKDLGSAVMFYDTTEDGGAQSAGSYNKFINCIFENCIYEAGSSYCIVFSNYDQESAAFNNDFINCTFTGSDYLFLCNRTNYGNKIINCIITGIDGIVDSGSSHSLGIEYSYSNFWNNGFPLIPGTGNFSGDPLFKSAIDNDYRLQATSPCINAGINTSSIDDDYNYLTRNDNAIDVGAHEYHLEPLVFFRLNENSGTITEDLMKTIAAGSLYGAVWHQGVAGTGLSFDGVDNYVDFGNPATLNMTGSRTISAWIKPASDDPFNTIAAKYLWGYSLFTSNGVLCAYMAGSSSAAYSTSNDYLAPGNWYYVAMSFDLNGDKKIHLYINGNEVSSYAQQSAMVGEPVVSSTIFSIGSDYGARHFFNGIIDEVKIFNSSLMGAAIWDEFINSKLIFYCDMNSNLNNKLSSSLKGSQHGAIWVKGQHGRGLNFDGVDDYVDFGNPTALNNLGSRTVSAWIKPANTAPFNTIVSKYLWGFSLFSSYGNLCAYIQGSSASAFSISSNYTLSPEEWYHVAMTFDLTGDKKIHLYINGAEVNSYSKQDQLAGNPVPNSNIFSIGADLGSRYFFSGSIDEIKIFNNAVSQNEINNIYQDEK